MCATSYATFTVTHMQSLWRKIQQTTDFFKVFFKVVKLLLILESKHDLIVNNF